MAVLTVQNISETGLTPSFVAAAGGGDSFVNSSDERTFLVVKNTDASTKDVTVTAQKTSAKVGGFGQLTKGDIVVTVPATTGEKWIGPLAEAFNDAAGSAQVTYSAVTGVTVSAVKAPAQSG